MKEELISFGLVLLSASLILLGLVVCVNVSVIGGCMLLIVGSFIGLVAIFTGDNKW